MRVFALPLSAVVIIGGLTHLQNKNKFDIDFTGGVMMQTTFNAPMTEAQVTEALNTFHATDPENMPLMLPARCKNSHILAAKKGTRRRQWMFKLRDQEGAAIERQRAGLETDRARAFRAMTEEQKKETADTADCQ